MSSVSPQHCQNPRQSYRAPKCRNKVVEYAPKRNGGTFALCRKHAAEWREYLLDQMRDFVWALTGETHGE